MISLGLIGCGAVVHANYAQTLLGRDAYKVRYVCDLNPLQADSAASLFDAEAVPLDTLIEKADAIIISTPPSTHSSLVRAALRPGRPVLCEKPYMTTYGDAIEIDGLAKAMDAQLYVGHFRRAFPHLALARELVALGLIGDVTRLTASEGGRFLWKAVSSYTIEDPSGGVLWDTGSHTLDMALFASRLDGAASLDVHDIKVDRDKPEPSHSFRGDFTLSVDGREIAGRVCVSRKAVLPNLVHICGTQGELVFVTDLDDRVRLTTDHGSIVLRAERSHDNLMECFDLQLRRILLADRAETFAAHNFLGQVQLIEALANA
jgi:predicted dehydrogenase